MIRVRDPKNLACAALFIGLAVLLASSALSLPVGTASEMGPGYFPLALALILGALGMVLAVTSFRVEGAPMTRFEWRGFILITLAIVAFGATVQRLGFIPAAVITIALSVLASERFRLWSAVVLTALLVLFCWAVFVWGLKLPVRLIAF